MTTTHKDTYEAPSITVFEVKSEGVICASDDPLFTGLGTEENMEG